jgi:hypothetical protein
MSLPEPTFRVVCTFGHLWRHPIGLLPFEHSLGGVPAAYVTQMAALQRAPGLRALLQCSDYAVVRWVAQAIFDFLCEPFDGRAGIVR